MFTPISNPHLYRHQTKKVTSEFSLLCWNIHKENLLPSFNKKLHELLSSYPSDFLLFQEYKMPKKYTHKIEKYSYSMATNIETKAHFYGLFTASKYSFDAKKIKATEKKEFFISTKKSLLLTKHSFTDDGSLYLLNIHGINFVPLKIFKKELEKVVRMLQLDSDAMIISGDFNSWSKKRIKLLKEFQNKLGLKKAEIAQEHHIKKIFFKPLDHIFYKGVELISAKAIDTKKISDHNPIYATFKKIDYN